MQSVAKVVSFDSPTSHLQTKTGADLWQGADVVGQGRE